MGRSYIRGPDSLYVPPASQHLSMPPLSVFIRVHPWFNSLPAPKPTASPHLKVQNRLQQRQLYIANRASLALDRLSRTRNVEVAEPFLRKNIVFSDDDFQTFLKDWNREIGFDPGEVIEAFMKWKIERHYRELRSEVLYNRPENVADPMQKIWRALRWKS